MVNIDALICAIQHDSNRRIKRISDNSFTIGRKLITVKTKTIVINKKILPFNGSPTDCMKQLDVKVYMRGWYFHKLHSILNQKFET
jgi:hypothetical protein